jgi:hypothetical protein
MGWVGGAGRTHDPGPSEHGIVTSLLDRTPPDGFIAEEGKDAGGGNSRDLLMQAFLQFGGRRFLVLTA